MMIFFTGSYTQKGSPAANPTGKGIGCFQLDLETGNIELRHYTKQRNPSYMVISEDKKYLYAVEEMFENLHPEVFAYRIAGDGKLAFLNSQKLTGDYACHLAIVQDRLIVANYMSGNALSYPISKDGSLAPVHQVIQHEGTGPDKHRQEAAHAHMIYPFKDDHMYVLDLTLDKAQAYGFDRETKNWLATPGSDIQIGINRAKEMLFMGASFPAKQLYDWGIVNRVFDEADFMKQTIDFAKKLSRRPSASIAQLKRLAQLSLTEMPFDQRIDNEAQTVKELFLGEEAQKAIQDFIHKNK